METLFELLDSSLDADEETLVKIKKHSQSSTINLCQKHARRTSSYSYSQSPAKTTDTVAMTPFQYAMARNKWKCARYLLETDIRALLVFPDEFSTPLHEVARCDDQAFLVWFWNQTGILALLQSMKPEMLNQRNEEKQTTLMVAIRAQKDLERITVWGRLNPDFTAKDDKGRNLVHIAIEAKHAKLVEILLQQDSSLASQPTTAGVYPAHLAAMNNNTGAMLALCQSGANLNVKDDEYSTPLHSASRFGHVDMIKLLLSSGVPVNAVNWERDSAVHVALKNHNVYVSTNDEKKLYNVLSLFLFFGADFSIKNNLRKDAWEIATECFPNDKQKRNEFHQAINDHVQQTPSAQSVLSVIHYLKTKGVSQFDEKTYASLCACLDHLAPPQPEQQQVTRLWSQHQSLNQSTSHFGFKKDL